MASSLRIATPDLVPVDLHGLPRPRAAAKFLAVDGSRLWVRGVTYGPFRPTDDGCEYHDAASVAWDFDMMASYGIDSIRTYTVPPRFLLDAAAERGLRVLVGLPWEQHVAFLDESARAAAIRSRVRAGVREVAAHPALLGIAIGNEIPAGIVRWHGKERVEAFLRSLYETAKEEDPEALVTYVNFPTTEYLDLDFLDFVSFNVYLEEHDRLRAYLGRLQNIAGDRPLVLAEIGLDSRRHGEKAQAATLRAQLELAFASGCAGSFAFAWTDEWHRGGHDIGDWDFGLVRRDRSSKPALAAVSDVFGSVPCVPARRWPRISVVVCSYNGARTIRDTLDGLRKLDYPDFEVIVVDDGSTDSTATIAAEYSVRLIRTPNRGLSAARNTGLDAATGEIVAYTDDDAYPDAHWLHYLAHSFLTTRHAAIGGPNVPPPGDGSIAECVANAPGGPMHVLITDELAEHIPGCNMAFRRGALRAIGGFDARYRAAGDDVDVCWRIQEAGHTIGFNAAAMVWHHRRNSVRMYWRQQIGYGKAEALLEQKWPERYNGAGHVAWAGRIYGRGLTCNLLAARNRIYQGSFGLAPFQSVYEPSPGTLSSLPLLPEWYLLVTLLLYLTTLGAMWKPLLVALPFFLLAAAAPVVQAVASARRARFAGRRPRRTLLKLRALTALLHLMQPAARLKGRLLHGLRPWRLRGSRGIASPRARTETRWSETWTAPESRLHEIEAHLRGWGAAVQRGGDFDGWDLELRAGLFGRARLLLAVEEHGSGRQLARYSIRPLLSPHAAAAGGLTLALAALAAPSSLPAAVGLLLLSSMALAGGIRAACASAATLARAIGEIGR